MHLHTNTHVITIIDLAESENSYEMTISYKYSFYINLSCFNSCFILTQNTSPPIFYVSMQGKCRTPGNYNKYN